MAPGRLGPSPGLSGVSGQSTVEYLVVLGAFVAMLAALALLWRSGRDGTLVGLATGAASHGAEQGSVGMLKDVTGY